MKETLGDDAHPGPLFNYQKAVDYIQKAVPENEPIFVASARDDRICSADPLFYFLSDRPPATKYYEFYRGHATQDEIQKSVVEDLEKNKVHYILKRQTLDQVCSEPNLSSKTDGSKRLDQYIQAYYEPVKEFGQEQILKRKSF